MGGKILLLICAVLCSKPDGLILRQSVAFAELSEERFTETFINECLDMQLESIAEGNRFLMLVNKEHALPEGYEPKLQILENGNREIDRDIYYPLKRMLADGAKEGLEFVVASAYRGFDYQKRLLEEDITALMQEGKSYQEAYDIVTLETMPPGYSEHSTGLAVDIVSSSYQILDAEQEATPEIQWLQEHCMEYGFILRYPKAKTRVTGISYESWHYRYVGVRAAREITARGLTLEEYLEEKMWEPERFLKRFAEVVRQGWLESCARKVVFRIIDRAETRIGDPERWYRLIAGGIKAASWEAELREKFCVIGQNMWAYLKREKPLRRYLEMVQKEKAAEVEVPIRMKRNARGSKAERV